MAVTNSYYRPAVQVTITGATGHVGYSLLFRIASGEMFGPGMAVAIRLLDIERAQPALAGIALELEDCAFPLLSSVMITANPEEAFNGTSWALLIGGTPRRRGMDRGDLLAANGGIFGPLGRAIADHAAADVRVFVVANPANINCLIARAGGRDVPDDRWFGMTRLDENRARTQLARMAGVPVAAVTNIAIWGNHSATQYPDGHHARINGRPAPEVISDHEWLYSEFVSIVQRRGASVIAAGGRPAAASCASAIIDSVRSIHRGTSPGDWTSLAVIGHGEYGIPDGLVFGYPVRCDGFGWQVVEDLEHDAAAQERLRITTDELLRERAIAQQLVLSR